MHNLPKRAIKYYNNGWTDTKSELTKKVLIGIRLNLYKTLQATYSKANYFLLLSDDKTVVVLDKEMPRGNRSYYISFKETGSNNIYSTFEFKYMANLKDEFINFEIHDNHGNKVEWSKLSYCLNKEGIDYGTFNNGFSYMENDFNNDINKDFNNDSNQDFNNDFNNDFNKDFNNDCNNDSSSPE